MRPIEGKHPYLYLDGIVLKRSWADEVRNVSLLVAIGVNADGYREILSIVEGTKEDKADWSDAQRCASHPEASQGTGHLRYLAGHLGCLPGSGRECRRDLPPGPLAALRRALVPQCLQPCAEHQDARGLLNAKGHPRPGGPHGCEGQGRGDGWSALKLTTESTRDSRHYPALHPSALVRCDPGLFVAQLLPSWSDRPRLGNKKSSKYL